MTSYNYEAIFEITDVDRPGSALYAEACAGLDAMAAGDGARLIGDPTWAIHGERLVITCLAEPLDAEMDPDEYVDEIAVERACRGDTVRLTRAEIVAAVRRMYRAGHTPSAISRQLGVRYSAVRTYLYDENHSSVVAA